MIPLQALLYIFPFLPPSLPPFFFHSSNVENAATMHQVLCGAPGAVRYTRDTTTHKRDLVFASSWQRSMLVEDGDLESRGLSPNSASTTSSYLCKPREVPWLHSTPSRSRRIMLTFSAVFVRIYT